MWGTSSSLTSGFNKAALAYAGMVALTDVASAVGKGVANAIEAVMPSGSYNNPSHLGNKIDTRA